MEKYIIWDKKHITGPAWVFFNTKWELLCVIEREGEKQNKSWKRAGQLFVPAWKKRAHEKMEETMIRELWEETWIKKELNIISELSLESKWLLSLHTNDVNIDIEVFTSMKEFDPQILEKCNKFFEYEIIQRTFINIREILEFDIDKIRPWLYEILYLFYGCGEIQNAIKLENGQYSKKEMKRIEKIKQEIYDLL